MSAKDDFFKKVQENNEAQQTHEERVKSDIQVFRSRMSSLAKQVEQWLHGSGIEVSITEKHHHDESIMCQLNNNTNLDRYTIASVSLKNQTKIATLNPVGVYGGGARGWVSLVVDTPSRAPRLQQFLLRLDKEEDNWTIRSDIQPVGRPGQLPQSDPLTEETFFKAIESLA